MNLPGPGHRICRILGDVLDPIRCRAARESLAEANFDAVTEGLRSPDLPFPPAPVPAEGCRAPAGGAARAGVGGC